MSSSLNQGDDAAVLLKLDEMPLDSVHECEAVIDGDVESLILYRDSEGGVRAWRNVCPHAGRRLDYAPGKFIRTKQGELVCAVHGATFALPQGNCVAGPCKGDCLCAVDVRSENDAVVLAEKV